MTESEKPHLLDPTAFEIEFDPRAERMRGVAIHGNTPFDVPWISHVHGNLWQGGCTTGLVLPKEIINVVSLYKWEQYTLHDGVQVHEQITAYDSEGDDNPGGMTPEQIINIATAVNVLCENGPTLVHCQAGLNRSSLIAAVSLILAGVVESGAEATALLRKQRSPACLCNKSFERWLALRWPVTYP